MSENIPHQEDRPLDLYNHRGYAINPDGPLDDTTRALDAATALTASRWGPPFDTPHDDECGEWWLEAYEYAARAVEKQIVDGLSHVPEGSNE